MTSLLYGANVAANGIRQHYLRYGGKGPALVVVPGITSPAITWGFVADALADSFDIHILDVRGRGLSETRDDLAYDLDSYADDLLGFVDALGLKRFHLLGHSMGARIAIRAARRGLPGLDRLVLADPPVTGPGRRSYPTPLSWYVDSIRLMRAGGGPELLRSFSPTWTDEQLRLRAEWLHTCDERAIVETYRGFHEEDIHGDLPHLKQATLLLTAGRGGVITDADIAEIRAIAPAIRIATVPDAGHMIPWDDLSGFVAAVGSFLLPQSDLVLSYPAHHAEDLP